MSNETIQPIADAGGERWILIGTGEGASSAVVADLRQGLHDFMCCCGKMLEVCQDETVLWVLTDMDESGDAWALDEANGRFQYSADFECSQLTITRLSTRATVAVDAPAPQGEAGIPEILRHGMNCSGLIPGNEVDCTCGLRFRIEIQTEREMHNAWRKRAEEAEAEIDNLKKSLFFMETESNKLRNWWRASEAKFNSRDAEIAALTAQLSASQARERELRELVDAAEETFTGILNSDWRTWEELASADEFERWAKSRSRHMLSKVAALSAGGEK
jgi:hypothetical protein